MVSYVQFDPVEDSMRPMATFGWVMCGLMLGLPLGYHFAYETLPRGYPREFAKGNVLTGTVREVADGDTLTLEGTHGRVSLRLQGLAAPEIGGAANDAERRAGEAAKAWMVQNVRSATLSCTVADNRRTYNRIVAVNLRCVRDLDLDALPKQHYNGKDV